MHCTLFNVVSGDTTLVGYNFDWFGEKGRIWFIPRRKTDYGYFITTRFGRGLPYEGMNEHGLYLGQTAVPAIPVKFSLSKKWSISTGILVKILRECRSLDEAMDAFRNHSILFGTLFGFPMLHFMIVEPSGRSVVVEYVDGDVKIFHKTGTHQVMTNFYLSDPGIQWPRFVQGCGGYDRHAAVSRGLEGGGVSSVASVYAMLEKASVKDWVYDGHAYSTIFSNVHNLTGREIHIVYMRNYTSIHRFRLDDELSKGLHYYKIEEL